MKRKVFVLFCIICCIFMGGSIVNAQSILEMPEIKIILDGEQKIFPNAPIAISGRTLLPVRWTVAALGVPNDDEHIIWNPANQSVIVRDKGLEIYLKLNDKNAKVNGKQIVLDVPLLAHNERTYIPIRFISEALGKKVEWDGRIKGVYIANEDVYERNTNMLGSALASMRDIKDSSYNVKSSIKLTDKATSNVQEYGYSETVKSDFFTDTTYLLFKGPAQKSLDFEAYYTQSRSYVKPWGREWLKASSENGSIVDKMGLLGRYENIVDEMAYVGLNTDETLTSEGQFVLKGAILFQPAFHKLEFYLGNTDTLLNKETGYSMNVDGNTTTFYIDKVTNKVSKIEAQITVGIVGNSGKHYLLTADMVYDVAGHNQGVKIEVPAELLK